MNIKTRNKNYAIVPKHSRYFSTPLKRADEGLPQKRQTNVFAILTERSDGRISSNPLNQTSRQFAFGKTARRAKEQKQISLLKKAELQKVKKASNYTLLKSLQQIHL